MGLELCTPALDARNSKIGRSAALGWSDFKVFEVRPLRLWYLEK
jgi:hypothetical protein